MSTAQIGLLLLVIFFGLMFLRVPIAISLSLASIITLIASGLMPAMYADIMHASVSGNTLMAIPFFIIAGNIMDKSGISKRIVTLAEMCIGDIPGGLGIISIIVLVFWGAISGSGPATVVALGPVLLPMMIKAGYDKAFAASILAAGAGIAVIIPPSITFIVFGTVAEGASVGKLFSAGILPGVLMGIAYCMYVLIYSMRHGYRGRKRGTLKEILVAIKNAFWGLLSPVIILGGIYGGIFTPTESACIAAVYSLLVGVFIYKEVTFTDVIDLFCQSVSGTGMILLITAGAGVMAWLINIHGIATLVSNGLLSISPNPYIIILMMFVILLIAGFFLEGVSIVYLFVPLLLPAARTLGCDITWFGVMMVVAISIGMITPPVACNLYPAAMQANVSLTDMISKIWGFVIAGICGALLIVFIPQISLWLPALMGM